MKHILKIVALVMISNFLLHAKAHIIKTKEDFERCTNKYEYSVVCFVPSQKLKTDFDDSANRLKAAALQDEFKKVLKDDVGFLLVDLSSKKNKEIAELYGIGQDAVCTIFNYDVIAHEFWKAKSKTTSEIIKLLYGAFGDQLKLLIERCSNGRFQGSEKMPNYYENGYSINDYIPYPYWPYSRWGTWPYGNNSWELVNFN